MDKTIMKILDAMTGKEVWQYTEHLLDECDIAATRDFYENYHTHMCYTDHNKAIDFQNEQTKYLARKNCENTKIILQHKRELLRAQRLLIIAAYNELLYLVVYSVSDDDIEDDLTLKLSRRKTLHIAMTIRAMRYNTWHLHPDANWDEIIGKMSEFLSEYNSNVLKRKSLGELIGKFKGLAERYKDDDAFYTGWIENWGKEEKPEGSPLAPKEQLKEYMKWLEEPCY